MKYYLYSSNDWSTTDELLTYEGCAEQENIDDEIEITVVLFFLKRIFEGKIVPLFIEESIYSYQLDNELHIDHRFMIELYTKWTEDEYYPLVIVGESDLCANYILRKFPPVEKYC